MQISCYSYTCAYQVIAASLQSVVHQTAAQSNGYHKQPATATHFATVAWKQSYTLTNGHNSTPKA